MSKKKKVVVIKRHMWATPKNIEKWNDDHPDNPFASSVLVDGSSGQRCCLGFIAVACGVPLAQCKDRGNPSDLDYRPAIAPLASEVGRNSDLSEKAILINDNADISDKKREQRLLKLFADSPYELKFVD